MINLERITIATINMLKMVKFYNKIFNSNFQPFGDQGMQLGKFLNLELLLCPNEIVGIKAEKNRIQFRLCVEDVDNTIKECIQAGGKPYGKIRRDVKSKQGGICDPDGNSIEIISYNK